MTEGLFWLALLAIFIGLSWAGWREYRKVEAYRHWAREFEQSKYDIYTVLGRQGSTLVWGKPTPQGPIELKSCSLETFKSVHLWVDQVRVDWQNPPEKCHQVTLELEAQDGSASVKIPFTDMQLAVQWVQYLNQSLQEIGCHCPQDRLP